MSAKLTPSEDGIRPAYKVFMEGLAGKDLVEHLLTLEMSSQAEGIKGKTVEEKAFAMERIGVYYHLRTYLADMSKPVSSPVKRSQG